MLLQIQYCICNEMLHMWTHLKDSNRLWINIVITTELTLHAKLGFLEILLHVCHKLPLQKWQARSTQEKNRTENIIRSSRKECSFWYTFLSREGVTHMTGKLFEDFSGTQKFFINNKNTYCDYQKIRNYIGNNIMRNGLKIKIILIPSTCY